MKKMLPLPVSLRTTQLHWAKYNNLDSPPNNKDIEAFLRQLGRDTVPQATYCVIGYSDGVEGYLKADMQWRENLKMGLPIASLTLTLLEDRDRNFDIEVKEVYVDQRYRKSKTKTGYSIFDQMITRLKTVLEAPMKAHKVTFIASRLVVSEPYWGSVAWAKHAQFKDKTEVLRIKNTHQDLVRDELFPLLRDHVQAQSEGSFPSENEKSVASQDNHPWVQSIVDMGNHWETPMDVRQAKIIGMNGKELLLTYDYGFRDKQIPGLSYGVWRLLQVSWHGTLSLT